MSEFALSVRNVSKNYRIYTEKNNRLKNAVLRGGRSTYREFLALNEVSFEVPKGSTFGVIGGNGAGKSTLLKLLAKIIEPDSGSISIDGRVSALLELGAGFHPELSGRENVYLNGAILGIPKGVLSRRFDSIVEFSGLAEFIDNPVKTYSSGMYARLGFAVAVNVEPDVLLIDEVLSVGDEGFQRRSAERIASLRQEGRTVLIVSHGLDQVRTLCDSCCWIDHGVLRSIGRPADVIREYLNESQVVTPVETPAPPASNSSPGVSAASGDIRIVKVEADNVSSGMPCEIRIAWHAETVLSDVIVGFGVRRTDGMRVAGTNTRGQFAVGRIDRGPGGVRFRIPKLHLLPGVYDLEATIADTGVTRIFSHVEHGTPLQVLTPRDFPMHQGVVDLDGRFEFLHAEGLS